MLGQKTLSQADRLTAEWVAKQTRIYGPLTQKQIRQCADDARRLRDRASQQLAYGLTSIANEMRPGEVVKGAIPWWKRL